MEFDFNINHIFPDTISLVAQGATPKRNSCQRVQELKHLQIVIDILGIKSAKAQKLSGSITSLHKSQINGHHIYVLKDPNTNNGYGSAVGFIKVGKKRLFLLDHDGNHNEMNPLCVLDFYVHESQQRRGCGLRLFKHMLANEDVKACHLAVDRPSHKFISFLKKHFSLWATVPQGFFKNRTDTIRLSIRNDKNERNSQFRPLSRAVSDDVIKRNRQLEKTSAALKDIRPMSGFEMGIFQGHDHYGSRNNRRRRWNADGFLQPTMEKQSAPPRANLYSRFAYDDRNTSNGLPPLPPSRRNNRHGNHTIHPHKQGTEMNAKYKACNEDIGRMEQPEINNNFGSLSKNHQHTKENGTEGSQMQSSTPPLQDHKPKYEDASDQALCNRNSLFQAKTENTQRYAKPSDMIAELKEKDEKSLQQMQPTVSQHQQNSSWKRQQMRGTRSSWNILGVPTWQYWNQMH